MAPAQALNECRIATPHKSKCATRASLVACPIEFAIIGRQGSGGVVISDCRSRVE